MTRRLLQSTAEPRDGLLKMRLPHLMGSDTSAPAHPPCASPAIFGASP